MGEHGITFQNHSRTHDHLIRRLDDETDDDWSSGSPPTSSTRRTGSAGTRRRPDTVRLSLRRIQPRPETHGRIHGTDRVRTAVGAAVATGRFRRPAALSDGQHLRQHAHLPEQGAQPAATDHRGFPGRTGGTAGRMAAALTWCSIRMPVTATTHLLPQRQPGGHLCHGSSNRRAR